MSYQSDAMKAARAEVVRQRKEGDRLYEVRRKNRKKAQKLIAETPRPAWMDDPSLLPKRPPGRAA